MIIQKFQHIPTCCKYTDTNVTVSLNLTKFKKCSIVLVNYIHKII